jgi:hypothetical protein
MLLPRPIRQTAPLVLLRRDMSEPRRLRCYEYVNRPYEEVRAALHERALQVFQRATTAAAARADALVANLRIDVGVLAVGVDVRLHVRGIHDEPGQAGVSAVTRVAIGWEAARSSSLFPTMTAELSAWALSSTETQLEIEGEYRPPMGPVGNAIDAVVGHRIAEASVKRFLDDVVEQLRRELPAKG